MIGKLFSFLDANKRQIDRIQKIVEQINNEAAKAEKISREDFAKKTKEFRERIKKGETLESLLSEVFAVGREAAWKAIGLRPYDTQLIAGIALFEGSVAEQKTGEGKTLSALLPLYLRSLTGNSVHLVTVNDYLARVGAGWNGPTFNLLGVSVGVIVQEGKSFVYDPNYVDDSHGDERLSHLRPATRKEAYQQDVLYGTNNEFGFDYLRDNMVSDTDEMVQRGHYYGIVDEVDSVLIDEARTPLIISAPDSQPTDKYYKFAEIIKHLSDKDDYTIDEKVKTATLTEKGIEKIEKVLGIDNLYEKDFEVIHHVENALRARTLYLQDRDYVVKDDQITIVDEFTGRLMFGRRWSDGLHQAIEAKEKVTIQQESKTLATISFQNYFRMYEKLGGMTGTAATEAEELHKIYGLDVVVIPTHRPIARKDNSDLIYKNRESKYLAIAEETQALRAAGRPILIGTTSIEKNEIISKFLTKKKIPHNLLNAKNHEREAFIIAEAGKPGSVTVATNMAGRGVDIILGGAKPNLPPGMDQEKHSESKEYREWQKQHDQVVAAGGLHVIGTERHESRRIDNQLRGRAGRLGDPGSSRFYLSLEDDLMRIFGGERIIGIMNTLQIADDQPIENSLITRTLEQAQGKVESFNFDARKRVVEYDDVSNQQRNILYKLRREILQNESSKELVLEKLKEQAQTIVAIAYANVDGAEAEQAAQMFAEIIPFDDGSHRDLVSQIKNLSTPEEVVELLVHLVEQSHKSRENQVGEETMRRIERFAYLSAIDSLWIEHLTSLDDLREGIGLRGYAQKDPLVEFKNEAFALFDKLMVDIDAGMARRLFRIVPTGMLQPTIDIEGAATNADHTDNTGLETPITRAVKAPAKSKQSVKIGRNDPCPCGAINPETGKVYKYKRCGMINAPWHRG